MNEKKINKIKELIFHSTGNDQIKEHRASSVQKNMEMKHYGIFRIFYSSIFLV